MLNALSGLKLGRARNVRTWEQVVELYTGREWVMVTSVTTGRMAYAPLEVDQDTGRIMALVMLENTSAPAVFFPTGSLLFTISGRLVMEESGAEATMDAWDLVHLDNARSQRPRCKGLYLGVWAFPHGNPLLQMIRPGRGP